MKKFILVLLLISLQLPDLEAQQADSLLTLRDTLMALQAELQELKVRELLMQQEIARSDEHAREDSLRKVRQLQRMDSLRRITTGYPVVIEGDTLFTFYSRSAGVQARMRAANAQSAILALGHSLSMRPDSIHIFESEYSTDIMGGEKLILSLTDMDGMWMNTSRQALGKAYGAAIRDKVEQLHEEYGIQQKVRGILLGLLIISVQVALIWVTLRLFRRFRRRIILFGHKKLRPFKIKDYEVLNVHRQGLALLFLSNVLRLLVILLQLLISIPLLFSIFPETKTITYKLFGYAWNPAKDILLSVIGYLPNLFKIVVIYICFKYLVRGMKFVAGEIADGKLKINGFYPEWARPTYYILRVLAYSFMIVMIWPLLPSSNSHIFQGMSVFLGVIVSLGSTSIISNMMAGLVMTYMRPFRIGDYIKLEENEGEVIEKNVLATRIKTPKNDIITIPNSAILSSKTFNYTASAEEFGVIVHTRITYGYSLSWQKAEQLLIEAALRTKDILAAPKPFVLASKLDDFYVCYELNAYTRQSHTLLDVYSDLHKNVLDRFREEGLDVSCPHIYSRVERPTAQS